MVSVSTDGRLRVEPFGGQGRYLDAGFVASAHLCPIFARFRAL